MSAVTITVDTTRFGNVMNDLYDAMIGQGQKADFAQVIQDEARLLNKQIIKFIPPKSGAQGKQAIKRDIRRAMKPLNPDGWKDQKLVKSMKKLMRQGNDQELTDVVRNFKSGQFKSWRVTRFDPRIHDGQRKSRGRVYRENKVFVYPAKEHKDYSKRIQNRTGRFKASFAVSYIAMGGKVQGWIVKHVPSSPNAIYFSQLNGTQPFVVFGSRSPGSRRLEGWVTGALRARGEAINKRIKLINSGYAKDVAQGMRPSRKVKKTVDTEVVE